MAIAQSKITRQGQISVPSEIRKRLGLGPGSVIEWDEVGEQIVVRRAGRVSSEDIHDAVFDTTPSTVTTPQMKEGIRDLMRKRHAKR